MTRHIPHWQRLAERIANQRPLRLQSGVGEAAIIEAYVAALRLLEEQCERLHAFTHWDAGPGGPRYNSTLSEKFSDARRAMHADISNVPGASLARRLQAIRREIATTAAQQLERDGAELVAAGHWGVIERRQQAFAHVRYRGRIEPSTTAGDLFADVEGGILHEPTDNSYGTEPDDDYVPSNIYDFTIKRELPLERAVWFRRSQPEAATIYNDLIEPLRPELTLIEGSYLESGSFRVTPGYCIILGPFVLLFESKGATQREWPQLHLPRRWGVVAGVIATLIALLYFTSDRSPVAEPVAPRPSGYSVTPSHLEGSPERAEMHRELRHSPRELEARLWREVLHNAPVEEGHGSDQ